MKISVRDLSKIQVRIKDLGGELEKISVRVLGLSLTQPRKPKSPPKKIPVNFDAPAAVAEPVATKQVEINIAFPQLQPFRAFSRIIRKTSPRGLIVVCLVVAAGAVTLVALHAHYTSSHSNSSNSSQQTLQKGNPPYATIVPGGKNVAALGGWTRVSPPDRNPVYAYVDNIGGVQIDVSEQPLPDNFKTDTATQVAQLAEGYNATDKFEANGTTIYVGTSASGPQSVIFASSNLLILIKSASPLTNNQWAAYISNLQ